MLLILLMILSLSPVPYFPVLPAFLRFSSTSMVVSLLNLEIAFTLLNFADIA